MEQKSMFKRLLSLVVVFTMLLSSFVILAVPAAAIEGYWSEEDAGLDDSGNYHPKHAWGYTFDIASVNPTTLATEGTIIITNFDTYKVCGGNFKYVAHAFFKPTAEAGVYEVVREVDYFGKKLADILSNNLVTEADFADGGFVMIAQSSASRPIYQEGSTEVQYAGWQNRVAIWALANTIGAKATLSGIDLAAGTCTNGTLTIEEDPSAAKDPYAGKLSIVLSDNDTILSKTADEAIDLLTDGDWVLDAGAWGTGTANVVAFQNKNPTNVSADGNIKLIWEFDETPEPYNNINFGLYADPNVMMGYPSEEDVFFSNDGVNWVGGYSSADIGYGESFVTCYASFEEGATQPGTIIGQVKLRKPQTYKFVKVEFYFPKSPFTVDNGYTAESAKPRWEFFGLTEAFDFEYEEVSTFVPDFNPGEYYASRSGWHGTYIYNNADAYALAEFNGGDAIDSFKHVAFAPVEGVADRYEVVGVRSGNTASDDYLEFPEGGFIWVARTGANSGSVGRIAAEHLNGMNVGHVYDFKGFDIEGEFVENDATYTRVFDTTLENIALGSTYTTDIAPSTTYDDEGGITLTDGIYLTHKQLIDSPLASYKEACWFSLNCNNTDREVAIDVALGDGESLYDLSKVVLYTGGDRIGSGIAEMKKIEVFYTVDGETYEKFGEYNYQGTPNTYLAECIIEGETVTASDIRVICYPQDGKNMVFLSELEAYGVKVEEFEYPDGYTVVDGETGKWQAAEGDFDFGYKYEVVGDNLVIDVIVNDDLVDAGAEASTGNGVATNIRLWVNYGNAKWDRLYDAYLKGGAAALFSKDAAGTVGTAGTIAFAEGVFTYTIPLAELAGGKGEFQFTICVSNTDAEGKNNACLYAFCDTFAWSAWDAANAHTITLKVIENATNVALNKPYTTTDVYPEGDAANYPDEDGKSLTDGVAAVEGATYSSPLWVGFHKNLDAIITVDLEKDYYLNKFVVAAAANLGAGINIPSTISVRYSMDKETWVDAGTAEFAATEDTTAYATITLANAITARYVEFTVNEGAGNWIFVSEVEAYGESVVPEVPTVGTKENPAVIEILPGMRGYMGEGYATLKGGDEYYFTAIVPVDGNVNANFYVIDAEYNGYSVLYSLNGGELLDNYNFDNPGLEDLKAGDVVTVYVKVADEAPEVELTAMISLDAVGSMSNPEEIEAGEIETEIAEGNWSGHNYEFVAPADGIVTITMADQETGWVYSASNVEAGIYGDMHYSDDDPIVKSESIEVKAGDVITISISTYGGMSTAGTVKWTLAFEEPKPDVVELAVSHVNAYNWGTFEAMIISGDGKTVEEVINQKPQWWIVYTVENIDGKYVATSFLKNSEECYQVKVPTGGFLFYVFDANSAYAAADNGALLDYTFVLGAVSLEGVTAIDTTVNAAKIVTAYAPGVEIPEPPVTSNVVNAFNIAHYSEGSEGADGAYIFTTAEAYDAAKGQFGWWRHVSFAPVEGEEGKYEVIGIDNGGSGGSGTLSVPENGFVWMAFEWPAAGKSGEYALNVMNTLAVGDIVIFNGIDFENCTTEADATAEKWVDPDAKENVVLGKEYEISGVGVRSSYYADLTDGVAVGSLTYNGTDWFGFYHNNTDSDNAPDKLGTATIDLGATYALDSVRVNTFFGSTSGITTPEFIKLEVSVDGETFEEVEVKNFEESTTSSVAWVEFVFDEAINASSIRLSFKLRSSFVFINEIEAYGEEVEIVDPNGGKLSIELSDNDKLIGDLDTAIDLLTDGDFALNAEAWGGNTNGVVLFQNLNATNSSAYGQINLIWEFNDTPDAYNHIKLGLYSSVESMIGYPSEEDIFFSNDGVNWVGGYSNADIGYGETIPDAMTTFDGDPTKPGTVIAELKIRNPQNYKFVKVELYFPKSPFTVDNGYTAETAKPRWEFFGVTEFEISYVEPSSAITDFNITEYWESRFGRGKGSFAFTTADAYAVAWDNFISTSYTLVSFAPVEGFENVYEVVSNGAASGDVAFPEGGFIWVAYNSADAGSFGKAALDLFATMTVGDTYEFTGFDFAGEFVQADATVEKWTAPVEPKPEISGWGAGVEVMTDGYTGLGEITGYEGNNDKIYGFGNNLLVKAEYDFTITIEETKFDAITLYALDYAGGGVMLPESVKFVVGDETFDAVITANENGIATIKAELGKEVTASEIKVLVVMGESPYTFGIFNMFTELTVDVVETKPTALLGDVNGNGEIEMYDYILVKRQIMNTIELTDEQMAVADVNGNGEIEMYDYILIKRHIMGTFVIGE